MLSSRLLLRLDMTSAVIVGVENEILWFFVREWQVGKDQKALKLTVSHLRNVKTLMKLTSIPEQVSGLQQALKCPK